MEKLAEIVELPPVKTPGWSSLVARRESQRINSEVVGSNPTPDFTVSVPGWCFWLIVGMGVKIMADRIANAWGVIKERKQKLIQQIADENASVRARHAEDVAALRRQIDEDGMSDADRQALAEMEAEAAGGAQ